MDEGGIGWHNVAGAGTGSSMYKDSECERAWHYGQGINLLWKVRLE